jgi:multiple sugar transport system permease protein
MRPGWKIGRWLVIAFVVVWSLFPIYWAINTSLMSDSNAQSTPARFFPFPLDLSNYSLIFSSEQQGYWLQFSRSILNTVIECGAATVITLLIAVLSSYAFARMEFRFKNSLFYLVIVTLTLPAYATLIPLYRMMTQFGLVNTYPGLILVYVSGFLPLAVWILYNYFQTIPKALEEAAAIDGASPLFSLIRVILPITGPGITSAGIICFLTAWGQFLFPLVLTSDITTSPITVFLTTLKSRFIIPYTLMNAVGILSIIVPAAIVIFLNRYIIKGMVAGSVK